MWSRGGHVPLRIEGNETRVLHRVAWGCKTPLSGGETQACDRYTGRGGTDTGNRLFGTEES